MRYKIGLFKKTEIYKEFTLRRFIISALNGIGTGVVPGEKRSNEHSPLCNSLLHTIKVLFQL